VAQHVVGTRLADIGTDHAYLPIALLEEGKINRAVASDLNAGPLESAVANARDKGYAEQIDARLGDGLASLEPGEADTIAIAGMGGLLIAGILETGEAVARSARRLVLQPMNARAELRHYLVTHGYEIVDETLAREGDKFYEIIAAEPTTTTPYRDFDDDLGRFLLKDDELTRAFLSHHIGKIERILASLEQSTDDETRARFEEKLKKYEEAMACLSTDRR
jgi:tRNA (adenine22-N1)-methyltransferase